MIRSILSSLIVSSLLVQQGMGPGPGTPHSTGGGTPAITYRGCSHGTTSASFSTTGATFEIVATTYATSPNAVTDSLGNTLTDGTPQGVGPFTKWSWHTLSSTSGSTTFSVPNHSAFCIYTATVLTTLDSGTDTGTASNTGTTCQPNASSINPGAGHVVFTAEGGSVTTGTTPVPTISNTGADSYNVGASFQPFSPGTTYGEASAYVSLTGASNLTWNWATGGSAPCVQVSFH